MAQLATSVIQTVESSQGYVRNAGLFKFHQPIPSLQNVNVVRDDANYDPTDVQSVRFETLTNDGRDSHNLIIFAEGVGTEPPEMKRIPLRAGVDPKKPTYSMGYFIATRDRTLKPEFTTEQNKGIIKKGQLTIMAY